MCIIYSIYFTKLSQLSVKVPKFRYVQLVGYTIFMLPEGHAYAESTFSLRIYDRTTIPFNSTFK